MRRLVGSGFMSFVSLCASVVVGAGRSVRGDRVGGLGAGLLGLADDVVDEAALQSLLGSEPAVAVGVLGDLLDGLAGVVGDQLGHLLLHGEQQLGLDLD